MPVRRKGGPASLAIRFAPRAFAVVNIPRISGNSEGVGEIARTVGLTRQTVYRMKDDPAAAEAALSIWGM